MKIIAHRGASAYKTENTMAAFRKAVQMNADGIELDVRLTKDNIPVIHHDPTINRLSNGKGYVHELTLKELQAFSFKKKSFLFQKREKIVTLAEFLMYIKDYPSVTIHIELKNNPSLGNHLAKEILQVISDYPIDNEIIFSSFDHDLLKALWLLDTSVKIGLLFNKEYDNILQYMEQIGMPIVSLHPKHHLVTADLIAKAHLYNIQVNPYTINQKKKAISFRNLGVDGLITNDPHILKSK